jgi:hypothetical protein
MMAMLAPSMSVAVGCCPSTQPVNGESQRANSGGAVKRKRSLAFHAFIIRATPGNDSRVPSCERTPDDLPSADDIRSTRSASSARVGWPDGVSAGTRLHGHVRPVRPD